MTIWVRRTSNNPTWGQTCRFFHNQVIRHTSHFFPGSEMEPLMGLVSVISENCWVSSANPHAHHHLTASVLPKEKLPHSPTARCRQAEQSVPAWLKGSIYLSGDAQKRWQAVKWVSGLPHLLWMALPELCSVWPAVLKARTLQMSLL